MIVKDEAKIITETLEHLFPYIEYCVIADTGSTDSTPTQIQTTCDAFDIPYTLVHHYWVNFGQNRTQILDLAHSLLFDHQCAYYLMFDADDSICGELPLDALGQMDAYYCPIRLGNITYNRLMLFRCGLEWGYKGVLHEYPYNKTLSQFSTQLLPGDYHIEANSRGTSARNKQPDKYLKDAQILVQALRNETDPALISRYLFYAARSFMDAYDYPTAIEYFTEYLRDSSRWSEERFEAQMCIGHCRIQTKEVNELVQSAFLNAWVIDPVRVEPFFELARFYRLEEKYPEAYAFARIGWYILQQQSTLPNRYLFVQRSIYEYALFDELAVAAYWTGRKQECLTLCTQLLQMHGLSKPDRLRIQKNLAYCEQ